MSNKFRNRYRIPSARMHEWDYTADAAYFITICTAHHNPWFGEIVWSPPGVSNVETPCMASLRGTPPDVSNVETPCMASLPWPPMEPTAKSGNPIVLLSDLGETVRSEWLKTPDIRPDMNLKLGAFVVMPDHFHAILIIGRNSYNSGSGHQGLVSPSNSGTFGPQRKNLASVVRGFKSAVTIHARRKGIDFEWQTRFYDRIIRNYGEYDRIDQYIEDNPRNWKGR